MKKQPSNHALAAKAIRQEVKQAFPLVAFRIKSRSFSGGSAIDVEWTNGPTSDTVTKLVSKYQYGHFDVMTDCYDITNSRNDIPQVKYVQIRREVSEDIKQAIFEKCRETYGGWENLTSMDEISEELKKHWHVWRARDYIYRITCKQDFTNGYQGE